MTVRVEQPAPRVAELVMDRPEAKNALSTDQARQLGEAARALAEDPDVSVVVLASALADAFCVGADLKERNRLDDDGLRAQRTVFVEAFAAVREIGRPSVAAVEGVALGGGYELALSCDLIVAADTATVGLPDGGWGHLVAGAAWAAVNAVAYATLACLDAVLYLETRMRTEGLDIALGRALRRGEPVAPLLAVR